jgi:hypothetical protein
MRHSKTFDSTSTRCSSRSLIKISPNPPSPSLADEQGDIPTLRNQDISILLQ